MYRLRSIRSPNTETDNAVTAIRRADGAVGQTNDRRSIGERAAAHNTVNHFGSTTNEVRGAELRKLFGEDKLRTDWNVNNFESVDRKQI